MRPLIQTTLSMTCLVSVVIVAGESVQDPAEKEYNAVLEAAKKDYDAKIVVATTRFVAALKAQMETLTKKGDLDGALRIRDRISSLESSSSPTHPKGISALSATVIDEASHWGGRAGSNVLTSDWRSTNADQMYLCTTRNGFLVFDLGAKAKVVKLKLWNYNENGGNSSSGFRKFSVYGGDDLKSLRLITKGELPQAPGKATDKDYGVEVPMIADVRYLKLQCDSNHRVRDVEYSGLTRVEIIGSK